MAAFLRTFWQGRGLISPCFGFRGASCGALLSRGYGCGLTGWRVVSLAGARSEAAGHPATGDA